MRAILGYRSFYDLRRGWRFNNPSLEQLGLVRIAYQDIDDLAGDEPEWADAPQVLRSARPAERTLVLQRLFETMRQGLCIATRYLDRTELDQLRTLSFANLREPWGFTEDGIEAVYQLEESELVGEPLPNRDNRQSILLFEAAEGGAGVLTRIATEPNALAAVSAEALEIMHFQRPTDGHPWTKNTLVEELDENGQSICEAGCYRCLLSYYNQPDHPVIDRKDAQAKGLVLDILCRLTTPKQGRDSHLDRKLHSIIICCSQFL